MKIFAALYLISPAFFCLKLLVFSSEIAERECKEGKFTVHLEKTQLSVKNPMNTPPCLALVSPSPRLGLAVARGAGGAGPCCKGELRTLPLCVSTTLVFLAGNGPPASPKGDLPTSAPWLLWYLTEVFPSFPCCS